MGGSYLNRLDFELSKVLFIDYEKFLKEKKQAKPTSALNRNLNFGNTKNKKLTFFVLFLVKAFVFYCPKHKHNNQKEKKRFCSLDAQFNGKKNVKLGFSSFLFLSKVRNNEQEKDY